VPESAVPERGAENNLKKISKKALHFDLSVV
jgi:hypothetical protein